MNVTFKSKLSAKEWEPLGKEEGDVVFRDNEHLRTQWKMLIKLCDKGYMAGFCTGYDEAKEVVDWYLSLPLTKFP